VVALTRLFIAALKGDFEATRALVSEDIELRGLGNDGALTVQHAAAARPCRA
jgi:hypothetical protein